MGLPLREREGGRQGFEDALVSVSDWTNSQFACVYIHLRICLCVYSPQEITAIGTSLTIKSRFQHVFLN